VALSCAILLGVMAVALAGVAAWAYATYGAVGLAAAVVAWLLCTIAAFAALLVSVCFAHTPHAASANLSTMLIRMGVPLVGLLVLPQLLPSLTAAGLLTCVLACYLVALVVETALAIRHVVPTVATRRPIASPSGVSHKTAGA